MIKPILFCDFDGTICHQLYWRSLPQDKYEKVQNILFRRDTTKVKSWMRGEYAAEEINIFLSEAIGVPFEELWQIFEEDCKTMEVSQSTLEKLASLRARFIVMLTTSNMDSFTRYTQPALKLDTYFDYISNSYFEKKLKTDKGGELFIEYAKKYNVPIDECIVLDDSKAVCESFKALGGTAYLVTPQIGVDYYLDRI